MAGQIHTDGAIVRRKMGELPCKGAVIGCPAMDEQQDGRKARALSIAALSISAVDIGDGGPINQKPVHQYQPLWICDQARSAKGPHIWP